MPVDQYIGGVEHAILHPPLFKIFYESLEGLGICIL